MEYVVIYRQLELQQHLPLQVSALIIFGTLYSKNMSNPAIARAQRDHN